MLAFFLSVDLMLSAHVSTYVNESMAIKNICLVLTALLLVALASYQGRQILSPLSRLCP